jgi:hypothetical protein
LEKLWPAVSVGDGGSEWKSVENAAGLPLVAIEISNWRSCDGPLALEAAAPIENRGERHHRATTFGYRNLQLEKLWPAVSVGDGGPERKLVENDAGLPLMAIKISNWRSSGRRLPLETAVPRGNSWRTPPGYHLWL